MAKVKLGIIGGSGAKGVVQALGLDTQISSSWIWSDGRRHYVEEAHGAVRQAAPPARGFAGTVDYLQFTSGETEVYFILRHGKNHDDLPADLDQRKFFAFLQQKEVDAVVLTSATGSLDTNVKLVDEGGMVVNSGVFRGFGYKGISLANPERPHPVMAKPYHDDVRRLLLDSIASISGASNYDGGLYVESRGNQFESPAEIADLICRLDQPRRTLALFTLATQMGISVSPQDLQLYQRLAENLSRTHAQVGMNAGRETVLAQEFGLPKIALVSFPVNYGAGLIPEEQVNHERTKTAIENATAPYIVPFLRRVIEKAPEYLKSRNFPPGLGPGA